MICNKLHYKQFMRQQMKYVCNFPLTHYFLSSANTKQMDGQQQTIAKQICDSSAESSQRYKIKPIIDNKLDGNDKKEIYKFVSIQK